MTELSHGLDALIGFFNNERLHQGLDYQTPNEQGCFPMREKDILAAWEYSLLFMIPV
jgi:hypothetical protein